jgi:hypothetical protein
MHHVLAHQCVEPVIISRRKVPGCSFGEKCACTDPDTVGINQIRPVLNH